MKTNMGLQVLILLVMILFSFCSPASFASVSKNLVPENTHESMEDDKIDETYEMLNQSKYSTTLTRGGTGGRSGGRSTGAGNNENGNGQSNSSPQGGANGVVPVYAAGAAAQRRNHKGGAAPYNLCWKVQFVVIVATSSFLLHIPM